MKSLFLALTAAVAIAAAGEAADKTPAPFAAPGPVVGAPVQDEASKPTGAAAQQRSYYAYAAWACADGHVNRTKPRMSCRTEGDWRARAEKACAQRSCAGRPCALEKLHVGIDCSEPTNP